MATKAKQPAEEAKVEDAIRPNDLAKELGVDGKRVRAFLRDKFTRPEDSKNTNWALTPEMVEAVKERFTPKPDAEEKA